MKPYVRASVNSLMLFLAPLFSKIEKIFLTYAPEKYHATKKKIEDFLSSTNFLLFLLNFQEW